jgi:hypothetical protein
MMTEHESWIDWARQSAEAENRNLRVGWQGSIARAEAAEAKLAMMQSEMNKIANNLGKEIELLARAEVAEAALAIMADDLASMTVHAQIAEDGRQIETRRAERALDTLARYEQQQWMARAIGAEAAEERMLTERVPRRIEGTLPADDLRRAFVDGAAWWNFKSTEFTMFNSERREAEAEAEVRFPGGKPRPVEVQP